MNNYTYLRVSTDIQEEKGTEKSQRYALEELFNQKKISLTKEFKDLDASATEFDTRLGLQNLIDELIAHPGSHLYITEQNRLTREPIHWFILVNIFNDNHIKVFMMDQEIRFDTPENELATDMRVLIDRYSRKKTSVVASRGIRRRIAEGKGWGPTPKIKPKTFNYWYYQKDIKNKVSLAKVLGVSRQTVYNFMKKNNIEN